MFRICRRPPGWQFNMFYPAASQHLVFSRCTTVGVPESTASLEDERQYVGA